MPKLGVNIDHVATLRQARKENEPDPIQAAIICQKNGASSIVCHLREDRRHIQDSDVFKLRKAVKNLTFELSLNSKIVDIAYKIKPDHAMFVPERRQEVTTEGGLDVIKHFKIIEKAILKLKKKNIKISLFINALEEQVLAAKKIQADIIELHTGPYAHAFNKNAHKNELEKLSLMAQLGSKLGLIVTAGHGLNYKNVKPVAKIKNMYELNIGHSIISRSIFVGLPTAVKEMKSLIQ